ncbi:zinc finger BED domain-containing protein 1-like [Acyrthosiphon pisum]|uniref:Zinc finger BED domain-containing protein 1-like n=1 Tax=Acyrthosiphon pisum TaxID=7029 RepID=A0A8R2B4Z4_ACYPI|nr:zinc finger BED domain-containing protein 1-like [Acyrthosiphon pisum]|eukprot:XP_008181981.1 PREDICTED: zinc finger BED domain-containing protein 1-like [Acyrthosiphon pisum]
MRVHEEREEDENTPGTSEGNTSAVIPRAEIVTTEPIVTRQKQMVLSNRFGTVSEHQINEFHEAIVRMIAEDLQPLSIVENSGFRRMIKLLDSRYEIPSRRALGRTIIPQIMEKVKGNVQILLNAASHIAITTDIWTSMNTDSFMTLTAHFVDTNLRELSTVVLCTKKLESNHTGVYLSQVMTEELMEWNILNKVVAIVTDGAVNIKLAVRLMDIPQIPCTAHKLNLIVQQSLEMSEVDEADRDETGGFKNILKKCRNIVAFFKRSEVGNRILVEKQKQLGINKVLKVKQDVRTRWNSTLLMLERLVQLKEPLTIAIISLTRAPIFLDHDEWNIVEDIIPLLRPFNCLTVELSAEQYPTISKVIPLIRGLQGSLVTKIPRTLLGQALKTNLIGNITKRFDVFEKQTITPSFSRATLLDPRFKKVAFGIDENANEAEKFVISEIADLLDTPNAVNEQAVVNEAIQDNVWEFLQSKVTSIQSQSTVTSSATALMRQYLSISHQDLKSNIFTFWNQHKSVLYPLSNIAEKYAIILE